MFERLLAIAAGGDPPSDAEIAQRYASSWLAEVPTGPAFFSELAPMIGAAVATHGEPSRPNEARVVLELVDGSFRRFRCTVEDAAPHRIDFQIVSRALDPAKSIHRVIKRNGRSVHVRDYGGDGPLLLLLHGSGCDATVWEGMVPNLRPFRVLAQDLPGHGASPLPRLSVAEAMADAEALLDELNLGEPVLVGHSLGGWIALHHAAARGRCRGLVCLDGPTALAYAAMGLEPNHPGFVPDPPDVATDLEALQCPALITLCMGTSTADAEWMVPFRKGLSDHITRSSGPIRVEWQSTGHMMVLSHPKQTAHLVTQFVREQAS
ncbi:MAG: alpha/beta fold hydrolase [Actinomycetota bacterium]